jgi:decaprenylphospho-beta-D-erythro-pentofuranosid-2-ulose 2-reductase
VVLGSLDSPALDRAVATVRGFGVSDVQTVAFDPVETWSHARLVDTVFDSGDIDVVVLCPGVESLESAEDESLDQALAVDVLSASFVGSTSIALQVVRRMKRQGHGTLVTVVQTVGARHGSNDFVVTSAMAGLDAFAVGLAESAQESGTRVIVCRTALPGYPGVAAPSAVGAAVASAIRSRRSETIYVPASLRAVASGMRLFPRPLSRRLRRR